MTDADGGFGLCVFSRSESLEILGEKPNREN